MDSVKPTAMWTYTRYINMICHLKNEQLGSIFTNHLGLGDNYVDITICSIPHSQNKLLLQAIAAMLRSHEADPRNLEVLLALGVSHTNGEQNIGS